jgi:carboxylate-amine ligase
LIDENRWRAKRFGVGAEFLAFDGGPPTKCKDVVATLLDEVGEDARRLGCEGALGHVRGLLERGTSAHRQLAIYQEARAKRDSRIKALQAVVDWLVASTVPAP